MSTLFKSVLGAFAAVFATISSFAADVTLPGGVTEASFGDNTVTDGTTYYDTLQSASEAVCGTANATLYCKPGADVGSLQHAPVTATLTIYGNGAYVSGGSERDFDIGNTDPSGGKDITDDMTLTVKDLEGCGAWGAKATDYTVNLVFEDCQNMGKVFITGTTGTLNITIKDSAFEGVIKEAVYSNADGVITLTNVDFSNLNKAVNLNHKAAGTQTVTITDCSFTACGADVANDQIPVRVLSSVDGGKSVLTVSGTTFTGTPEGGADILLDYGIGETTANISTAGTAANVVVEKTNNNGTPTTVPANTQNQSFVTVEPVAKIGETTYTNFAEALAAAKAMSGDVTVEIYEKVTLCDSLYGNFNSITFVGKDTDAEIYLDVQGYTTATGKTVNFTDLKLSKSVGGYAGNAGFMNTAFGIYDIAAVNYTNCTFLNGAYASSGAVTFSNCTFYRSHDRYGLWAYGAQNIVVDGCTFADIRGIKMYDEGKFGTTSITVKNTSFAAVTDKPAIVLTYGNSVTLENNTYGAKGTFELDLDGKPNGVTVTSDVPPTCINDKGACGVLVDGKIYTTVAQAAAVATSGSTVTLLHSSTETVEFAEGVTLNKNGFTADGVTVAQPVAKIGDTPYYTLADAVAALKANGDTLKLLADVNESMTFNYPAAGAPTEITVDLNGFTVTSAESTLWVSDGYVVTVKDSSDAKTGKIISTNTEGEAIAITRNGHVILESGYIYNDFCAVWLYNATGNGSFVMNGGTLEVPNGGKTLSVGAGKATINGGKILCNKVPNGGGWNTYVYTNGTLVITGGEFLGTIGNYGKTAISGGTFSYPDDPNDGFHEEHLASGYATKVNADGSITVYELPTSLQGTGTAEDPFLINNIDDLKLFRNLVNTYTQDGSNQFRGKYVKLMVDLDLAGENWEPIGKNSNGDHQNFLGHFDGNDKTISNLTIIGADHLGFFANVGDGGDGVPASVKNLNFHNVKISGTGSYVGTVIANGHATTIVDNVHVTGTIDISGKGYVGGLVGHAYIKMNDVSLIGSGIIKSSFWCCGGILGYAGEGSTVITNAHVEGIIITSAAGALGAIVGRAEDNNGTQPISGVNLSAKNVEIKTYTGDYGDSYSNNGIGYLYGGTATSNLSGNLFVDNVTLATSNGVNPTPADAKASIGDTVYFSLSSAISALKDGDTVTLLGNCELVSGIDIDKNITVDGAGYKVYAADIADDTEMFNIRSKVTITNLTFDADHKFTYGIQVQDAADVTLSDVSILYAGNNNWGAAVNLNGGKLFVSGNFTAFSGGENGGAFPFTGILYWSGEFKFADGVTASIADPTGATTDSDLLLVGAVGLLSIEDANTFLSQFNIPSGFAPYTLALDADIVSSFGGFTGASPLPWNTIIDYGKQILEAIDESTTETQVTVGLLDDTVIPDVFVYEDANFSINGNGKTLTGTIDVTDNVGTISNVVLTSGTTFVMTNVTTGCVKFGDNVTISSPVTIVPPANYGVGSAPLIEFTDGSGVKPGDFVVDQSVELPEGTEFVVDGNKIVLGTPVAKIGDVKYASLSGAIAAAKSGDTVTLLGDCGITTGIILNKNITIDGGNFTLTAVSGDPSLAQMVRVDSAATIKNITLAVNHKYDYGIQMNNSASDLTLENVTILYAGKAEGHKNGELLFGASVFLQQGNLLVKGKFTAFSGGETAGTFPFTGILYWPAGDLAPTFSFADGATASISDPTGATSDSDLLLVGAPGILSVDEADKMLSTFNIPAGFAPYTLKLDCPIVQGVGGGFTGASPLAWNTIIDYGKKILTVVNESTTETQVEVGILDDVEIPEVFVYEDANFSINGNGKELKGTIDFTDNVGTIKNVELTSDMTFVMTNVTDGCVKLGEGVIITEPVKVIPPDNFGRGEDSATLIEFAEGSELSLEDFEIDTSTVPEGSQIVQDGNKIIVRLPIAQVGNRKFATLAEAFEAANDGDTVRVLYSFNTNETIVINKAVTFDFSGDVITNTVSGAAIQVAAEGVKFIGGELVAKGNGIEVAEGGSSVIERGVYEVTGVALAGSVTVSGGTFNQAANVINAFKSDDCEAVDNGDGWCTVMDYVAQFGEEKYVSLQVAIDAAAATNPTVDNPARVTLLGNVAGSVTLPENVIINANGYTVQSVVDSNGYIVELHGGAYQVGKYPEPPPVRSIKIEGNTVKLSFVPRQTLKTVVVEASSDLKTWTAMDDVTYVNDGPGRECVISVAKPQGNNAFFRVKFEYAD